VGRPINADALVAAAQAAGWEVTADPATGELLMDGATLRRTPDHARYPYPGERAAWWPHDWYTACCQVLVQLDGPRKVIAVHVQTGVPWRPHLTRRRVSALAALDFIKDHRRTPSRAAPDRREAKAS
jgi:hypothetical protein